MRYRYPIWEAMPPLLILARLIAALLLATVGLQASAPIDRPLERSHGAAFSASTHEVALAAQRRAEPARLAMAPQPHLPRAPQPVAIGRVTTALPRLPAPRPHSTGPPLAAPFALRPQPRAPPLA
jgi:hypothetical protein